ncbi:hypothetical protein [Ferrimonas marina]|uniref:Uncharacterized protein n=1 Tax=Ferrimonas marina TaxID=299255 RepID=A0A1M5TK94_9GAMM|nr:hypothetical protein [Ferrimonas marina]SHH50763.1 hypothetical protein SAMN02745129_2166 [Ferrimonas marina]
MKKLNKRSGVVLAVALAGFSGGTIAAEEGIAALAGHEGDAPSQVTEMATEMATLVSRPKVEIMPETVADMDEAAQRAKSQSDMKGELSNLKLQVLLEKERAELKKLEEAAKTSFYTEQLSKMEQFYEDHVDGLVVAHETAMNELIGDYETQLQEVRNNWAINLQEQVAGLNFQIEMLRKEKAGLSDQIALLEEQIKAQAPTHEALKLVFFTKYMTVNGEAKAEFFYRGMKFEFPGSGTLPDGLRVTVTSKREALVEHTESGLSRVAPRVPLDFAIAETNRVLYPNTEEEGKDEGDDFLNPPLTSSAPTTGGIAPPAY